MVVVRLFVTLVTQLKVGSSSRVSMILWAACRDVVQYAFAGKLGWHRIHYGIVIGRGSG